MACAAGPTKDHAAASQFPTSSKTTTRPKTVLSASSQEDEEATEQQAPGSIITPASIAPQRINLSLQAHLDLALRPAAMRETLNIKPQHQSIFYDADFMRHWLETLAMNAQLQAQPTEPGSPGLAEFDVKSALLGRRAQDRTTSASPTLAFLQQLFSADVSTFRQALADSQKEKQVRFLDAKALLLNELRNQLNLNPLSPEDFPLLQCDLHNWLKGSLINWQRPLFGLTLENELSEQESLRQRVEQLNDASTLETSCALSDPLHKKRQAWQKIQLQEISSKKLSTKENPDSLLLLVAAAPLMSPQKLLSWLPETALIAEIDSGQPQLLWVSGDEEELKAAFFELSTRFSRQKEPEAVAFLIIEKKTPDQPLP